MQQENAGKEQVLPVTMGVLFPVPLVDMISKAFFKLRPVPSPFLPYTTLLHGCTP